MDSTGWTRLIKHWRLEGLAIAEGASESELQEFESREGVLIPNEFRAYLQAVNGMVQMAPHDCDKNLFAFWQLGRIKPVRVECPQYAIDEATGNFFVFADYIVWSWAYALEMCPEPREAGKVILIGGLRPQAVSRSFTEFVELYVQDAAALYAQP